MNESVFLPFRLIAGFSDGTMDYFSGLTERDAAAAMEAAQARHGDIIYYDAVTDIHYDRGRFRASLPDPPVLPVIDLTDPG